MNSPTHVYNISGSVWALDAGAIPTAAAGLLEVSRQAVYQWRTGQTKPSEERARQLLALFPECFTLVGKLEG